ncbi:Methyltransferase (plasmid) [Euzebya pacifica]|uniref:Methyltransferase n=1 Tax=Euzebya pacifica TaxID=1608957 RepID=A0A346Y715_9ACTN|nr:DNA adenine methylase [Euzebya pacifica]AXV10262.1 Methyltransferase [Euzebya pacifica]
MTASTAPFPYYGAKGRMADTIVATLPPHRVYLEPFFGSGAVLFSKPPATVEIVNDLDGAIVTFFRVLRERPDALEAACALTPYARDEFLRADPYESGLDDLELARRFWCRVNQSFAKATGRATGFAVGTARTQSPAATAVSRLGRFARCADRLSRVIIENTDAVDLVAKHAVTDDTVVYVDPPYPSTSRSSRSSRGGDYRVEMASAEDHERLADALHATPATVVVSGYRSSLYDRLYAGWYRVDVQTTAGSANSRVAGRTSRTESLWVSRPPRVRQLGMDVA